MREDLVGLPIVPRRSNPLLRRLRGIGAPLSALVLLVSEVEDALGARRKRGRHNSDNAGNDDSTFAHNRPQFRGTSRQVFCLIPQLCRVWSKLPSRILLSRSH